LAQGATAGLTVAVLVGYAGFAALSIARFGLIDRDWTQERLTLTRDLVESFVGHRTRLAQQPPERWHPTEDQSLERYLDHSVRLDRAQVAIEALPRGWMLVGGLALVPAFWSGVAPGALAVSIGGVLLGQRGLTALASGLGQLAQAAVAWRQARPLFEAGASRDDPGELELQFASDAAGESWLLEVRDLSFRHPARERSVLQQVDLVVRPGDRVLLEGESGSGKSTLAALLGGLREPTSGLLLVGGLDRSSLGTAGWRSRVVTVPQFHENHVFGATLAFNGLLGRAWPPTADDLAELEAVCRELGLGPLLERMPAGIQQLVGDAGWRLSHGERSRLFLARALCQPGVEVLILDETFGALDARTLNQCMRAVERRAKALVAIVHR
ncbi:MAG: ABC transporter ATP-binding protein, partial [Myxococcota bacterium]